MTRTTPPPMNLTLAFLRLAQGWSQTDLGKAAGISPNLLSDYERGRKTLSRQRLEWLVATLGLRAGTIDAALDFLREVYADPAAPGRFSDEQRRRIEVLAADLGSGMESFAREAMAHFTAAGRAERERAWAEALWESLRRRKPAERRRLVEEKPEPPELGAVRADLPGEHRSRARQRGPGGRAGRVGPADCGIVACGGSLALPGSGIRLGLSG